VEGGMGREGGDNEIIRTITVSNPQK